LSDAFMATSITYAEWFQPNYHEFAVAS
jgi:hypothetical protein